MINVSVDPSLIDVNVHPQKTEIRFSNEEDLLALITRAIDNTLNRVDLIVDQEIPAKDIGISSRSRQAFKSRSEYVSEKDFSAETDDDDAAYLDIFKPREDTVPPAPAEEEDAAQTEFSFLEDGDDLLFAGDRLPKLYYIGQLFGTYPRPKRGRVLFDRPARRPRAH